MRPLWAFLGLILFGCSQQEVLVVLDPYWSALYGSDGEKAIKDTGSAEGFFVKIQVLNAALPAALETLIISENTRGLILSPIYSGQIFASLRIKFPELNILIPLGPSSLVSDRTWVINENRDKFFFQAGQKAAEAYSKEETGAEYWGFFLTGDLIREAEMSEFLKGWSISQPVLKMNVLSFGINDDISTVLSAARGIINKKPKAIFIFLGSKSLEVSRLFPDAGYVFEGLEGAQPPRDGQLFRADRDWMGLFQATFEALNEEKGSDLTFFQELKNEP